MEGAELRDYVNEQPRRRQDLNPAERRVGQLLLLSFGLLCIVQATLNLSLRVTLISSKKPTQTDCNTTHSNEKEVHTDCNQEKPGHCNILQERFNALTRDRETLENRNNILHNTIKSVEEERDRLKMKLKELGSCMLSQLCPAGWKEISSRCYFLSTESKTWQESRQDCQSKGADLVVISSEQEQNALYGLDGDQSLMFWIGLHKVNEAFKWVDGSGLTKTFWQTGKPDHSGPDNAQFCVVMDHSTSPLQSWNNILCEERHRWLCEKEPCAAS